MYPSQHFIFAIIFAIILLFLFPNLGGIEFSIIILSTVLIDVDHYLYYVYKKKNLSLKSAYNWFIEIEKKLLAFSRNQRGEFYTGFSFLHGIEILILLFFAIYISKYFFFVLIGTGFHLLLDIIYGTIYTDRIDKLSVLHDFFKFKKLKYIDDI